MVVHPFDAAAQQYDATFSDRRLGGWLRDMVRQHLSFQTGEHILELGCGTGQDAVWFAEQDITVTATDASANMLQITQQKAASYQLDDYIQTEQLDLKAPTAFNQAFDGIFSNFGVLNCVEDRAALAQYLRAHMKQGSKLTLVVMSPVCPWEILWHGAHGQFGTAFRRFRSGIQAHVGDGETVKVWYPSPKRLRSEFAGEFKHVKTVGIGTLLPPSYLDHLVERWPGTFERLMKIDRRIGTYFPATLLNDHYLIEFEAV